MAARVSAAFFAAADLAAAVRAAVVRAAVFAAALFSAADFAAAVFAAVAFVVDVLGTPDAAVFDVRTVAPFAADVFAVDGVRAALLAAVPFAAPAFPAVPVLAEFLAAAARAAATELGFVDALPAPGRATGSATTSTVAAAFSSADRLGARRAGVFFAGVLRAGVFFSDELAEPAT